MIKFAARSEAEQRLQIPKCLGISIVSSAVVGVPLAVAGLALGGRFTTEFVLVAISLPGEMMQATWRFAAYVRRKPAIAALSDGICIGGQLLAFGVLWGRGVRSPGAYVIGWGAPAALSALLFCLKQRISPSVRAVPSYLRTHRDLIPNLLGEYTASAGAAEALPYVLVLFLGLAALGALRAVQVALGVLNVPLQGLAPLITAQAARIYAFSPQRLPRLMGITAVGGSILIMTYGVVLLVVPDTVGKAIAGASWMHATVLIIPLTVLFLGQWITNVAFTAMRIRSEVHVTFRIGTDASMLLICMSVTGAVLARTQGAAWGMGTALIIAAVTSWAVLRRRIALSKAALSPPEEPRLEVADEIGEEATEEAPSLRVGDKTSV